MKKAIVLLAIASTAIAAPASAHHLFYDLTTPFASRGECEAATAELDNGDREFLQEQFPDLFSSSGQTRSFIQRAFTCEQTNGLWYITDHLLETLASEWFQRHR